MSHECQNCAEEKGHKSNSYAEDLISWVIEYSKSKMVVSVQESLWQLADGRERRQTCTHEPDCYFCVTLCITLSSVLWKVGLASQLLPAGHFPSLRFVVGDSWLTKCSKWILPPARVPLSFSCSSPLQPRLALITFLHGMRQKWVARQQMLGDECRIERDPSECS